ncbi:hypothetical protein ACTI_28740 [Actinoplanes sp. OR16]|uniref:P-loop NTPase fold protein n=1 Tax=Actinoplanes sp. OR16 TaxID=946334 RepID=UPI000F7148B4|nr:P-loop NTPase fold protein [Actinoplanes sp. OR16]BBH66189.1 hypothetical protein ACTI_28740 [Actinoplanes sp. OR16]
MERHIRTWLAAERPVSRDRDKLFAHRPELWGRLQFFADHVVAAVHSDDESPGSVFGISAPWGSGKSSALGIMLDLMFERLHGTLPELERDERQRGFILGDEYVLTFSTYRANLHVGSPIAPRLSLAYDVLGGFPESYLVQLLENLQYESEGGLAAPIKAEMFLRKMLQDYSTAGPVVERWILDSFLQHRSELSTEETDPRVANMRHVHVELIDDLDRCPESFTAEVLAALNFWTALPNLFFVVAADEEHLKRSARAATDLHESYDGEALEKFVHFQLRIPPLITNAASAATYALELFPEDPDLRAGVEHFRTLLSEVRPDEPLGLLAPALKARTPRQTKRIFNELLQEFWVLKDFEGDSVKRIVARMVWPQAFDEFISPALIMPANADLGSTARSPRADWLRLVIEMGARVLEQESRDIPGACARLVEQARLGGIDIQDCPPELILYLSAAPRLVPAGPPAYDITSSSGRRLAVPGGATSPLSTPTSDTTDDLLTQVITDAQIALGMKDMDLLAALSQRIVQLVAAGAGSDYNAPLIGNLALEVEKLDVQLALLMHQIAAQLDPNHANIRINFASALNDTRSPAILPALREQLDWLAEHEPDFKKPMQMVQRARATLLAGETPEGIDELVQEALDGENRGLIRMDLFNLLIALERTADAEALVRSWLDELVENKSDVQISTLMAGFASAMARMEDETAQLKGADLLRYIVAEGFATSEESAAFSVQNYAIVLAYRDYQVAAAALHRIAYELLPQVSSVRAVYTRFLLTSEDPQNAYAVQQGQEVTIPKPTDDELRSAMEEVPDHFSAGPHWWEEIENNMPIGALPALRLT